MTLPQIAPDREMVDALSILPDWVLETLREYTTWDVDPLHRVQALYYLVSSSLHQKEVQKAEQEA